MAPENESGRDEETSVGYAAIRYTAWVVIVIAILYFAARYIMPLFYR